MQGLLLTVLLAIVPVFASPVDLVVARFNEDLQWVVDLKQQQHVRIFVYNKGSALRPSNLPPAVITIPLPNIGLASQSMLHHIVKYYDTLADKTVFTQAADPTAGLKAHRQDSGHLYAASSLSCA